ncbi:MAG: DNA mismatch repair endonuclease MutL [Limnochordia bacterium]|jgi:DNA mismatch repair protein MutL
MSPAIKLLDEHVANRIAAGEVIERPASVVKELLENAIDAGSKRVQIDVSQGGFDRIAIADDGGGIPGDQLPLAFARHATSKIVNDQDLHHITTLGFRGEALASIAAVARVEVYSRPRDGGGYYVRIEGGQLLEHQPAGCAPGTRIIVQDLFYNTPARKKFLKSQRAEKRHLIDWVQRIALANPEVIIQLQVDGEEIFQTPGTGHLKDTITALFGPQMAQGMLPVQGTMAPGTIEGYVGKPELAKGVRSGQYFILNNRYIQSPLLINAVERAYGGLLMTKRYPVAVLHLRLDPAFVDVNVHPTKIEVRFRDQQMVYKGVLSSVQAALGTDDLTQSWTPPTKPTVVPTQQSQWSFVPKRSEPEPRQGQWSMVRETPPTPPRAEAHDFHRIIGQVFASFILVERKGELLFIDQHAAHERILYQEIKDNWGKPGSQTLLFPVTMELSPQHREFWSARSPMLKAAGFHVEEFGGDTYLIRAVPTIFDPKKPPGDWSQMVIDLLEQGTTDDKFLISLACHGAIKAGQELDISQMETLVQRLLALESATTCPHGRPTILRYSREEMEKRFGR